MGVSESPLSRRHLGLAVFLGLVLLSGCVDYPPDYNVCLSCEQGIEAATEDELSVTVERSSLEIRMSDDGRSHWRVQAHLSGENVSTLADDPARVDRIADRAVTGQTKIGGITQYAAHGGNVRNVSARMENQTLVITFTVPSVGYSTAGGIVLVDQFHAKGGKPVSYKLGADRVVVRGPSETVVTNEPTGATTTSDRQAFIWERDDGRMHAETYIVFGTDQQWTTQAVTYLAISANVVTWVVQKLASAIPGSLLLFAVAMGALLHYKRKRIKWERVTSPGLDDAKHIVAAIPVWNWAGTALFVCGTIALAVGNVGGIGRSLVWTLFTMSLLVPVSLFGLLGWDAGRDGRHRWRLLFAIALVPLVMVTPSVADPISAGATIQPRSGLVYLLGIGLMVPLGLAAFYVGNQFIAESASKRGTVDE